MDTVDICNLSLQMLGNYRIELLDQDNDAARACKAFFAPVRDALLREHIWTFAQEFKTLPVLSETSPDSRFTFVNQIPNDCLRIIELDSPDANFRIIGKKLLSSYSPVILTYSKTVTDTTAFDALFVGVMQYALAAEIVLAITHDAKLANYIQGIFREKHRLAKIVNAQENVRGFQLRSAQSNYLNSRITGVSSAAQSNPLSFI